MVRRFEYEEIGAKSRERKLFCVAGECKSGLLLEMYREAVPIHKFGGFVLGVAQDFIDIIEFVRITIQSEIANTNQQC